MEIKPEVSVVILCKGRLDYLRETLPYTLNQEGLLYSVTVVDYGCPDNTFEELMDLGYPNLQLIKVLGDTQFVNRSHGRNIGAMNTTGKFIMFQDAEITAPTFFLCWLKRQMEKEPYDLARATQPCPHKQGTFMVTRRAFEVVRGFDEQFEGWGSEEDDLFERVEKLYRLDNGLTSDDFRYTFRFDPSFLTHLDHSNGSRTVFDKETDKWKSQAKNMKRKKARRATGEFRANLDESGVPYEYGSAEIERLCPTEASGLKRYDMAPTTWEWVASRGDAVIDAFNEIRGNF